MPVVQQLTLRKSIGDIPKGTKIMIVAPSESSRTNSGILSALRRVGFTDDQFNKNITDPSNWEYHIMKEEEPGELNLILAKFSQPIHLTAYPQKNQTVNDINKSGFYNGNISLNGNVSVNEPILSGSYWEFWKRSLGNFFWLFFIILFVLWIPFIIFKFILKFAVWGFVNVLNICTFGLLDLDTDWDDLFD